MTGTDRWFIKLKNGWQFPVRGSFIDLGLDTVGIPADPLIIHTLQGFVQCGFYGDRPGEVTTLAVRLPEDTNWQGEIDVSFQVWAHCSGVRYWIEIFVVGPDGVPYD